MKQCCLQSLEGQHLLAQKSYLDLIHGSKTWVTGGLLYISSDEPKGNERMWGQKWRKIDDKVDDMPHNQHDGDVDSLSATYVSSKSLESTPGLESGLVSYFVSQIIICLFMRHMTALFISLSGLLAG